jgi:hypothetical protein
MLLAWIGCLSLAAPALAEELCPQGLFETDQDKIVAALASAPVPPVTLGTHIRSSTPPETWVVSIGVTHFAAGGLEIPREDDLQISTSFHAMYDADRYVFQYVVKQETFRSRLLIDTSYFTTTTRPTPEQAKDIACVANELLNPPDSLREAVPSPPVHQNELESLAEVIVTGRRIRPICQAWYSDAHIESTGLVVPAAAADDTKSLVCDNLLTLEERLGRAVVAPYNEAWLQTLSSDAQQATTSAHNDHGRLRRTVDFILRRFGFRPSREGSSSARRESKEPS